MPALMYDDFTIGDSFTSPARTITEADVLAFAGLSGDFNPLHTDHVFAEQTPYGRPIAHGLLILSIASGLYSRLGLTDGTALALLGVESWNFRKPVFFGDTIHVNLTIEDMRATSRPDRGILYRKVEVVNQHGEVVQEGRLNVMVRRTPASDSQGG